MLTREQQTQKRWEIYKELALYQIKEMNRPDFGWANLSNKEEILVNFFETAREIVRVFSQNDK